MTFNEILKDIWVEEKWPKIHVEGIIQAREFWLEIRKWHNEGLHYLDYLYNIL